MSISREELWRARDALEEEIKSLKEEVKKLEKELEKKKETCSTCRSLNMKSNDGCITDGQKTTQGYLRNMKKFRNYSPK